MNGSGKLTRQEIIRYGVLGFVFFLFLMPGLALIYVAIIATYFLLRLLWLGLVAITRIRLPKRAEKPVVYTAPKPPCDAKPPKPDDFSQIHLRYFDNCRLILASAMTEAQKKDALAEEQRMLEERMSQIMA